MTHDRKFSIILICHKYYFEQFILDRTASGVPVLGVIDSRPKVEID